MPLLYNYSVVVFTYDVTLTQLPLSRLSKSEHHVQKHLAGNNNGVFNVENSYVMSRNGGCRGHDETSKERQELDALDRVGYFAMNL